MGGRTGHNGCSRECRPCCTDNLLIGVAMDRRKAHVDRGGSEGLRGRGNTLNSGGRNQEGRHSWFVVYRDLKVRAAYYMWLSYFSW